MSGKTGSLFKLAFAGGYALAGDGGRLAGEMRAIGEHMGALFQLRDDLLDVLGRKEGRPAGSDVAEGKISFPAVHYLSCAPARDRKRLLEVLRMPRDETPAGAIGLGLEAGRHLLTAPLVEPFVEALVQILTDPQRRAELVRAGREIIPRHDWKRHLPILDEVYPR